MPILAPVSSFGAQASQAAAQNELSTALGLCDGIFDAADRVRVNRSLALALSRRTTEMVAALSSTLELSPELSQYEVSLATELQPLEGTLDEVRQALLSRAEGSYLAQLLHQQRDRGYIKELSDRVDGAFDILMVKLRIRASAGASALSTQLDDLVLRHQKRIQELPSLVVEPAVPAAAIPPRPQLHFGRTQELEAVVVLVTDAASAGGRVAIMGGPGMGKTTLATAVLHHPSVEQRFGENRYFVPCDAAEGTASSFRLLAEAFGIAATDPDAARAGLLKMFKDKRTLLVLDNFESAWEAPQQRENAEQLLQFLDSLKQLSLIVTLRGTERPQGARWNRPFLRPLRPVSNDAARQIFLSIANDADADADVDAILRHLENVPLALVLMGTLAQWESLTSLLRQWEECSTAMLVRGDGDTRLTSLDVSIRVSLQSPRMRDNAEAQRLLAVLSLLPCGAVDTDISLWDVPGTPQALSVVLRTALATRVAQRIHVLAPIRSFILSQHPPDEAVLPPVYDHFFRLAEAAGESAYGGLHDAEIMASVASELANIDSVIRYALAHTSALHEGGFEGAVGAAKHMCTLHLLTGMGSGPAVLPIALEEARRAGHSKSEAGLLAFWATMAYNGEIPGDAKSLYHAARDLFARIGDEDGALRQDMDLVAFLEPAEAVDESRRLYASAERLQNLDLMARCCLELGLALERRGRPLDAIAEHERAIALERQITKDARPSRRIAMNQFRIAACSLSACDMARAIAAHEDALAVFRALRYPLGECMALTHLAGTSLLCGRARAASAQAAGALAVRHRTGYRYQIASARTLAEARAQLGDHDGAAAALARLAELQPPGGFLVSEQSQILRARGMVAFYRGDLDEARALLGAGRALACSRGTDAQPEAYMRGIAAAVTLELCGVECAAGKRAEVAALAIYTAVFFRATGTNISTPFALVHLAEATDDDDMAERLVGAVMLPLLHMSCFPGLANAFLCSATIAERRGQRELAVQRARMAVKHFGEIKDERRLQVARSILSTRAIESPSGAADQ